MRPTSRAIQCAKGTQHATTTWVGDPRHSRAPPVPASDLPGRPHRYDVGRRRARHRRVRARWRPTRSSRTVPTGEDAAAATVAEISAVTEDGRTVDLHRRAGQARSASSTSPTRRTPKGLGTVVAGRARPRRRRADLGRRRRRLRAGRRRHQRRASPTRPAGSTWSGSPTATRVAHHRPRRPARLDRGQPGQAVRRDRHRERARRGRHPAGGEEGDLPQAPGRVRAARRPAPATDPAGVDGRARSRSTAADLLAAAGTRDARRDPEPEYVTINSARQAGA